jgi:hypothetical protein
MSHAVLGTLDANSCTHISVEVVATDPLNVTVAVAEPEPVTVP